jgi:homoserine dehydrogenase
VSEREKISIGLIGLGVIGSGVARVLIDKADWIAQQVGCPVILKRAADCDASKQKLLKIPAEMFTTDPYLVLHDNELDIIIELIGGDTDALEYIKEAISRGKHVVTANKEVIAKHGPELLSLANSSKVSIRHEASVGGGIPIISPFKQDLLANKILAIRAIINGTTNYIVTRMAAEGADFDAVLKQAQALGYAEANPANDIEGFDAVYKLAILATIAFRTAIRPEDIYREGISRLSSRDFRYAKELGYAIKLLAIAKEEDQSIQVRVHPVLIPEEQLLAEVDGVFNAIEVEGDLTGKVIFYGRGAGPQPTSSAIVADIIQLAQNIRLGLPPKIPPLPSQVKNLTSTSQIVTRYYLRLTIADSPGVLAQISKVLGDNLISISSAIQKEADESTQSAEIVLMTHPARESAVQQAMREIEALSVVKEIGNLIRVED